MALNTLDQGMPKLVTATVNVKPSTSGVLLGIVCAASTAGTVTIYDEATSGTTNKIVDTLTLTAGTYLPLNITFVTGCNIVVGGTLSATAVVA